MMLSLSSLMVEKLLHVEDAFEFIKLFRLGAVGGAAGGKALHAGAYLVDVLDVAHVQTDHAHAAGGAHHQPLLLQTAQGFADGRAADAEPFR